MGFEDKDWEEEKKRWEAEDRAEEKRVREMYNAVPRKTKKAVQKALIIYDVNSLPRKLNIDFEQLLEVFKTRGILIYDGSSGDIPQIVGRKNKRLRIVKK